MTTKTLPTPEEIKDFEHLPLADRLRILDELRKRHKDHPPSPGHLAPPDIYFIQN